MLSAKKPELTTARRTEIQDELFKAIRAKNINAFIRILDDNPECPMGLAVSAYAWRIVREDNNWSYIKAFVERRKFNLPDAKFYFEALKRSIDEKKIGMLDLLLKQGTPFYADATSVYADGFSALKSAINSNHAESIALILFHYYVRPRGYKYSLDALVTRDDLCMLRAKEAEWWLKEESGNSAVARVRELCGKMLVNSQFILIAQSTCSKSGFFANMSIDVIKYLTQFLGYGELAPSQQVTFPDVLKKVNETVYSRRTTSTALVRAFLNEHETFVEQLPQESKSLAMGLRTILRILPTATVCNISGKLDQYRKTEDGANPRSQTCKLLEKHGLLKILLPEEKDVPNNNHKSPKPKGQ